MEVEEADEGILALVVPPVGDVTLNRKVIRDIKELPQQNVLKYKIELRKLAGVTKLRVTHTAVKNLSVLSQHFWSNFQGETGTPLPSQTKGDAKAKL